MRGRAGGRGRGRSQARDYTSCAAPLTTPPLSCNSKTQISFNEFLVFDLFWIWFLMKSQISLFVLKNVLEISPIFSHRLMQVSENQLITKQHSAAPNEPNLSTSWLTMATIQSDHIVFFHFSVVFYFHCFYELFQKGTDNQCWCLKPQNQ